MKNLLEELTSNLHAAIMANNLKELIVIIKLFHQYNIAIDNALLSGVSPIFRAIQSRNIDIVRAIINAGASIYTILRDGRSSLDLAEKDTEIYNLLKQHQQNIQNEESSTSEQILFIPPDGNCMYNAIIEGHRRLGLGNTPDLETLREWVYSEITQATGTQRECYINELEMHLISLIATLPRTYQTLADFNGLSIGMYSILQPYLSLYDSGTPIVESIRENGLINRYIDTILANGSWGGEVELQAISRVLEIEIIVHGSGYTTTINNSGSEHPPFISLEHTGDHYNLITYLSTPLTEEYTIEPPYPPLELEVEHLENPSSEDNSMTMLCIAALFIGCCSLYDNGYFQW